MGSFEKNSRKQRKAVEKSHHEADPTTFSRVLNPKERLLEAEPNIKGRRVLGNLKGERFHLIPAFKFPHRQQFFSRLLKPFFPVADVVERNGEWYSYQPHIKNTEPNANPSVDNILIEYLTGDWNRDRENSLRSQGRVLYFDFEGGELFSHKQVGDVVDQLWDIGVSVIPYAAEKTERMLAYWESPEGRAQVEAAFRDVDEELGAELREGPKGEKTTFDDFYEIFLERAAKLHAAVHEMSERAPKKSE